MTIYTKTITAGLALMLAGAPLIGTVSADELTSNGTVSIANETGELALDSADDITFNQVDLSNLSDFHPTANNQGSGKLTVEQTSANPTGTYSITVQQTGDWQAGGSDKVTKTALPINYDGTSMASAAATFVTTTAAPARGESNVAFNHDSKNFTLDLTGTGNLTAGVNESLTSEVTWTLTTGV
ncbi:chitinase [Leuconostoc pseudomesenteroides]|uniref:chitinase n=1 Tax=Leuconostoc pseudomesenteroides TaxID=33968 RepID=UPI00403DA946